MRVKFPKFPPSFPQKVFRKKAMMLPVMAMFSTLALQATAGTGTTPFSATASRPASGLRLYTEANVFANIHGTVKDAQGNSLPGVSVIVKGSTKGTSTNADGLFNIDAKVGDVLEFTIVGYAKKSVTVGSGNEINVLLEVEALAGNEIVVVGYGTQKKVNLTGAISTVDMGDVLGDRPVTSAAEALQGAAPGLQITTGSGQPGTSSSLNIRGFTSINGGAPLVLVDNVPMNIDDINPEDIATVTVLKDASASSIYGARAAFGVILITTKHGKRNQPVKFNYSVNLASTKPSTLPEKPSVLRFVQALKDFGTTSYWAGQDVNTWYNLVQQYDQDATKFPSNGITTVNGIQYPLAQTDIYKSFMPGGFEQLHNLSFNGGSEKTNFRVSIGYTDQDGILATKADEYKRYNLNAFLNTSLTSKLVASINVFYNNATQNTPQNYGQLFYNAITFGPYAPTGFGKTPDSTTLPYYTPNNILRNEPYTIDNTNNLRLYGKLEYSLFKGLKLNAEYTFSRNTFDRTNVIETNSYINPLNFTFSPLNTTSQYYRYNEATIYNAVNLYANYTATIANAHHISAVIGTNQEKSNESGFSVSRFGIISTTAPSINGSVGTINGGDNFNSFAVAGYFGRLNYDYKGRYLLEATGRYDGSSRFPAENRFGFFPSFSAGWNILQESFMKSLKPTISLLKLRASYGEIGNQVVLFSNGSQNYYPYIPSSTPSNSSWINSGTNILNVTVPAPPLVRANFTWERVETSNLGLDFGFLNNRLTGSADIFIRKTLGMLAAGSELPTILGAAAPLQNVADLKDKGWELNLSWKDQIKNFKYSLSFNLSNNQAYIIKYNNKGGLLNFGGNGALTNYYVGQRLGDIWGFQTQGFYTADDFVAGSLNSNLQGGVLKPGVAPYKGVPQNPGDIRYVDLNGDSVIYTGNNTLSNPGDRKIIGNNNRQLQFGINGSVSYKSFDVSFFIIGVGKRDIWISNQVFFPYQDQFSGIFTNELNYWTPNNTNAYFPRYYANSSGNTRTSELVQTRYLSNGAYMRLKNITVGYSLPGKITGKIYKGTARVFFSGENLLTRDHLPAGLDPEASDLGSGGIYPFIKKYSFGVNISF
jgi:TonB-linked SusC/RagA family outer membrane protein